MPRNHDDPYMIMLDALVRNAARKELGAMVAAIDVARRMLSCWENLCQHHPNDPDLLLRRLSNDKQPQADTDALEHDLRLLCQLADSRLRWRADQDRLNRIRLSLMEDPDFPGGDAIEELITISQDAARQKGINQ